MPQSTTIPNLINGVSQQPPALRLPSQAQRQENFRCSVAEGLTRRNGTRHVAKLASAAWAEAHVHIINRDDVERYVVAIQGGNIYVVDAVTGAAKTVNAPDGLGYLSAGGTPTFSMLTVADYTFIANQKVTVVADNTLSAARPNQAIIFIRAGNYAKTYNVYLNGTSIGSYSTERGDVASDIQTLKTTTIATNLHSALTMPSGYTKSVSGDVITITGPAGVDFTLRCDDDQGGAAVTVVVKQVQRFSDLPIKAPNGFVAEVNGSDASSHDNYHVKFESEGGTGVWKETLRGGERYKFDLTTMPYVLVREANGTFTFKKGPWAERRFGSRDSSPFPSFTGGTVSSIFFHQNRLGFLSGENVVMSRAGEFFDFWRSTATTILDDDPIDLSVSSLKVANLRYAVPVSKALLLFSSTSQFVLEGGDLLTPETASIAIASEYQSSILAAPVSAGRGVYFAANRGGFSMVREYGTDDSGIQWAGADVTSHCQSYIPEGVTKLAASSTEGVIVAFSPADPAALFVYESYVGEQGKLQSAWSRWTFPYFLILGFEFIDSDLFIVAQRGTEAHLERLSFAAAGTDEGASFSYKVDRGIILSGGVYNSTFNKTTYTLPYKLDPSQYPQVAFAAAADSAVEGTEIAFTRPSFTTVDITGNTTTRTIFFGVRFTSLYEFSPLYLRQDAGAGSKALTEGRLQVRRMSVDFNNTGQFEVTVQPNGRAAHGRTFASDDSTGVHALEDGYLRFPVDCRNTDVSITITDDSITPASFTAATWEATYFNRNNGG
jgi:hypothetical protein